MNILRAFFKKGIIAKKNQRVNFFQAQAQAAAATALTTTTLIHPIDFLKTRQVSSQSFFYGWNPILYYRGYWLHLARAIPHFMITTGIIDFFQV